MSNPFEDAEGTYYVLVNAENQHSLWPGHVEVPAGWTQAFGAADRKKCLAYIEETWTDMRPQSLVDAMESAGR
ncbi:MbtH family protein [Streptomyces griseus]|uniref:MbtH family protein n=1 Tax=Streptomyces griseus TaxID=1911 RepID=UPI00386E0BAF|nr:MbtH family protein [Streptomyces griseus]WTD68737.1 MbtH family protein [Streptomyces griseus]